MLSPFRLAGMTAAIFAICGSARSQELAPPGSGVSINKLVIESASSHRVRYTVKGGSPRLQAVVRRVEWAENELSVIEQLQLLKLDTVVNQRHLAAVRTAQLTNSYFPTGFIPLIDNCYDCETSLQRALGVQLAYEATPQAALQMIGFLEGVQTELDAELKALPPQEKKAAQDPIDALRPRLAALASGDVPQPRSQPTALEHALRHPPIDQEQKATPLAAIAGANPAVEVEWRGTWYAAEIMRVNGGSSLIHYSGWSSSFDEWVPTGRIRPARIARGLHR